MLNDHILFKYLVFIEWILFVITILIIIVLSVLVGKLNKKQFIRLFLSSSFSLESQAATMSRLKKAEAALSAARVKIIMPSIIFIISLSGIWFVRYKRNIHLPLDRELIALAIVAIPPIPIVIALITYYLKKVINRADIIMKEGE